MRGSVSLSLHTENCTALWRETAALDILQLSSYNVVANVRSSGVIWHGVTFHLSAVQTESKSASPERRIASNSWNQNLVKPNHCPDGSPTEILQIFVGLILIVLNTELWSPPILSILVRKLCSKNPLFMRLSSSSDAKLFWQVRLLCFTNGCRLPKCRLSLCVQVQTLQR